MRRACIVLWSGLTAYGLFHLLGLTGLSLACVYVGCGVAAKPHRSTATGRIASGRRRSRIWRDGATVRSAPLIGAPLGCWVCPWCVAFPQPGGHVAWVLQRRSVACRLRLPSSATVGRWRVAAGRPRSVVIGVVDPIAPGCAVESTSKLSRLR